MIAEEQERGVSWRLLLTSCLIFFALSVQAADDPFAGLAAPVITGVSSVLYGDGTTGTTSSDTSGTASKPITKVVGSDVVLHPGIYWGGINITGSNVTMMPGRYVMAGGGFKVVGDIAAVSGADVFIYNTQDPYKPTSVGAFANVNLTASADLRAPGAAWDSYYQGIAIYNDRALINTTSVLLPNGSLPVQGFIYSAGGQVQIVGGDGNIGLDVVASNISLLGSSTNLGVLRALDSINVLTGNSLVVNSGQLQVGGVGNVHFTNQGTVTVNSGTVVVSRLVMTNGVSSVFNFNGGALVSESAFVSNSVPFIVGGGGNPPTLQLTGSTNIFADGLLVANAANATGSVFLGGGRIVFNNTPLISIGDAGAGLLTASSGTSQMQRVVVGNLAGSQGSLVIAGGSNDVFQSLTVGNLANASGSVLINGGFLHADYSVIGNCGGGQMVVGGGTGWLYQLIVGNNPSGQSSLTVTGGILRVYGLNVGSNAGAFGSVLVTGGVLSNYSTTIGDAGSGTMVISNGSVSLGEITLGNSPSGAGSLTVAGGSVVVSSYLSVGNSIISGHASGTGSVLVTGGQLVTGSAYFGGYGHGSGSLIVSNGSVHFLDLQIWGGSVAQTSMILAGGTVVSDSGMLIDNGVLVTGGNLQVNWPAYIGWKGSGTLTVSNGTTAFTDVIMGGGVQGSLFVAGGTNQVSSSLTIGEAPHYPGWPAPYPPPPSTGIVTVSGGQLNVTNAAGTATLILSTSAYIASDWPGVGTNVAGVGILNLNGGAINVDRMFAINGTNSIINFYSGTLRSGGTTVSNGMAFLVGDGVQSATFDLNGGTHSFADGLNISSNANLTGSGAIIGDVTSFGAIAPGHSPGLLSIVGDLALMDSSVLTMEVGGPDTNQYDRIDVTGLLVAGGWLNVNFTNGYAPAKGEMFDLFGFGAATNSFAGITLPTFQYAGTDWDTSHLLAPASDPLSGSLIFIPEPSSIGLLLASAGVICRRQRRPGTARKQPPC